TAWAETRESKLQLKFRSSTPGDSRPTGILNTDVHVFAIEAVDDHGLASAVSSVAFTSYTVAPTVRISFPTPNRMTIASTPPSAVVSWSANDPDGTGNKKPAKYKYTFATLDAVQSALGLGFQTPTAADLQKYFGAASPSFASWDSVSSDTTTKRFTFL